MTYIVIKTLPYRGMNLLEFRITIGLTPMYHYFEDSI